MEKKVTRRDMIKALIAGSGGIVAAGFVPEKWLKPVVKSGVLPVHAQASITPTPVPDLFIQGGYYIYEDPQEDNPPVVRAFAFVSYEDIPDFSLPGSLSNVTAFVYPVVDSPAKDANVILLVDGIKEEPTKATDANGFVEWIVEYEYINGIVVPTSIDPSEGATLTFVLDNDKTSVVDIEPLGQVQ